MKPPVSNTDKPTGKIFSPKLEARRSRMEKELRDFHQSSQDDLARLRTSVIVCRNLLEALDPSLKDGKVPPHFWVQDLRLPTSIAPTDKNALRDAWEILSGRETEVNDYQLIAPEAAQKCLNELPETPRFTKGMAWNALGFGLIPPVVVSCSLAAVSAASLLEKMVAALGAYSAGVLATLGATALNLRKSVKSAHKKLDAIESELQMVKESLGKLMVKHSQGVYELISNLASFLSTEERALMANTFNFSEGLFEREVTKRLH